MGDHLHISDPEISEDHPCIWRYTARRALVIFDHPYNADYALRLTAGAVAAVSAPIVQFGSSCARADCTLQCLGGCGWRGCLFGLAIMWICMPRCEVRSR